MGSSKTTRRCAPRSPTSTARSGPRSRSTSPTVGAVPDRAAGGAGAIVVRRAGGRLRPVPAAGRLRYEGRPQEVASPKGVAWSTGRCLRSRRSRSALSISRIVCPPSLRLRSLAPLFPEPRAREPTAIRLPTKNRATIGVVAVDAFAAPRRRAFWKWQGWGLVAQETFITQPLGSSTRPGLSDHADGVPRLLGGFRQLRLRHHVRKLLGRSRLLLRCAVCAKSLAVGNRPVACVRDCLVTKSCSSSPTACTDAMAAGESNRCRSPIEPHRAGGVLARGDNDPTPTMVPFAFCAGPAGAGRRASSGRPPQSAGGLRGPPGMGAADHTACGSGFEREHRCTVAPIHPFLGVRLRCSSS